MRSQQVASKLESVELLLQEREYLVAMVNKLLQTMSKTKGQLENMEGQSGMMMTLMRDLMNQAQLANNTFSMVNEYFDCLKLIKRCFGILAVQAKLKQVRLMGPVFDSPLDKYYFLQVFSDERRFGQVILNFMSNSIKFTSPNGVVSLLLKVLSVNGLGEEGRAQVSSDRQSE